MNYLYGGGRIRNNELIKKGLRLIGGNSLWIYQSLRDSFGALKVKIKIFKEEE